MTGGIIGVVLGVLAGVIVVAAIVYCYYEKKYQQTSIDKIASKPILPEEYDRLLIEQNNKCAICKNDIGHEAAVDHNHETKKIRGLLCRNCNVGIGFLQDQPSILRAAAEYLDKHGNMWKMLAGL